MVIGKLPINGVADFAIAMDPAASYEESEDIAQLDLFDLTPEEEDEDDDEFIF